MMLQSCCWPPCPMPPGRPSPNRLPPWLTGGAMRFRREPEMARSGTAISRSGYAGTGYLARELNAHGYRGECSRNAAWASTHFLLVLRKAANRSQASPDLRGGKPDGRETFVSAAR